MKKNVYSILKSGWGLYLIISGLISIFIDISTPEVSVSDSQSVVLFRNGSFTLGWLSVVILMVGPAALIRRIGIAPMHKIFAFIWCFVAFLAWAFIHAVLADPSSSFKAKPNLAILGAIVLCWRLLSENSNVRLAFEEKQPRDKKFLIPISVILLFGLVAVGGKLALDYEREQERLFAEARAAQAREMTEVRVAEAIAKAEADRPDLNTKLQATSAGSQVSLFLMDGVAQSFTLVPAGTFTIGSPSGEEGRFSDENQVDVTLSQCCWLAKTEVTQAQWEAVMGSNPSLFKGANFPVENVSWDDVQAYLTKLNERGILPVGWKFALPTEAQWEYACRAGEKGPYSGGGLDEVGWFDENSRFMIHEVGLKKANAWGLYDMHGNVWELCADWYVDSLKGGTDPKGASPGFGRVIRSGCWRVQASECRAAKRFFSIPGNSDEYSGFRTAIHAHFLAQ